MAATTDDEPAPADVPAVSGEMSVAAFGAMYDELLRFARVVAPAGVEGADLLHDALVNCLARFARHRPVEVPQRYFARAISNGARSARRRSARRLADRRPMPSSTTATTTAEDGDGAVAASAWLDRLPPRQRACLYLRFVEDRSVEETAAQLGCSTGTIKSQTAKALRTLRKLDPEELTDGA